MNISFCSKQLVFGILFWFVSSNIIAQDTVKVTYYNLLSYSPSSSDKVKYLRQIISYSKPQVFVVNEIDNDASANDILNNIFNINGVTTYQKAEFTNGPDTDNMIFFDSDYFSLASQDTIVTALRLINRYRLYYKNSFTISSDSIFLDFYSGHLKASSGSSNEILRYNEVKLLKKYIENETSGTNIFFGGDMNFYGPNEPALKLLLDSGLVRFIDPADAVGDWHDNALFSKVHTQSTRIRQFGGGATGGLDDRFDFIFTTPDMLTGANFVKYIPDSYEAFGNDGNHLNDSLTALPLNPDIPDSITYALYGMSDHLPVLMKVVIADASGIDEVIPEISNIIISPNPANNHFTVSFFNSRNQKVSVSIVDVYGRLIEQREDYLSAGIQKMNFQMQAKGLYFISIRSEKSRVVQKLINS